MNEYRELINEMVELIRQEPEPIPFIEGWHQRVRIVPKANGGTDHASNFVSTTPQQEFTLRQLLALAYPDNKAAWAKFNVFIRDGNFATDADTFELARTPILIQWEIDSINDAIQELRGGCDDGTVTEQVQTLMRERTRQLNLLAEVKEIVAEQARTYVPVTKQAFEKPVAPHIKQQDDYFNDLTEALNPTRHTSTLGEGFTSPWHTPVAILEPEAPTTGLTVKAAMAKIAPGVEIAGNPNYVRPRKAANVTEGWPKNEQGQWMLPPAPPKKEPLPDLPKLNGAEAIAAIRRANAKSTGQ